MIPRMTTICLCIGLVISCSRADPQANLLTDRTNQPKNDFQELVEPLPNEPSLEGFPLSCRLHYAQGIRNSYMHASELSNIARAYAEAGLYEQALTIAQILGSGGEGNLAIYYIIHQYADTKQYEQAFQLALAIETSLSRSGELAYIASAYVKDGQYDEALEVIRAIELRQGEFEAGVLAEIAANYAQTKQPSRADEFFQQARELAARLNDDEQFGALFKIGVSYAEAGEYEQAFQIIDTFNKPNIAYKSIENFQANLLNEIAHVTVRNDTTEQADAVLSQVLLLARPFRYSHPNLLSDIAVLYAEIGQFDSALEVTEIMERHSWYVKTLFEIAKEYWRVGQEEQAGQLFDQSIEAIHDVGEEDEQLKSTLWLDLADIYGEIDQLEQANEALNKSFEIALLIGEEPYLLRDPDPQASQLDMIARKYAEFGMYDHALRVAQAINDAVGRDNLIRLLECGRE